MPGPRSLREDDVGRVKAALREWWGGRDLSHLGMSLFFRHFRDTGFVLEEDGEIAGFLIRFVSRAVPGEAYIHLAGVRPDRRGEGLARRLYGACFDEALVCGCREVRCVTSPENTGSVAFHRALGFELLGDGEVDGVPVMLDYEGPSGHRVLFRRTLGYTAASDGPESERGVRDA